ncbi:hypothetical protein FSP39_005834 [Pinctada imbricata]|uniref:Protein jagunal n=1 Tax=Pinctada imbricata TaxID=66713 RepID=A0AA88Y2W6_PINIB|nr:hypothetical protein FSP39_005834 [Pinctada imbricata]
MASKYGSRPAGTDGSDFWHRESVAWQYKFSSLNKSRLKTDLTVHILIGLLMIVRILPGITSFLGVGPVQRLRQWNLPPPRPWEYAWIISLVGVILGWRSMPKNESALLKQYMIGSVVFGVIPVLYGLIDQSDDLYAYLNEKKFTGQILGYPAVVVWFMFLTVATQIHGFGLYFAAQLIKSWRPRERKTK